jgi:radical SAM protein with 4Fe4S-binding SPASM domain
VKLKTYAALARKAFEANFRRLDHPFKLTFCITYWCNYKCQTCNIWQMKPRDELKLDEIQQFFKKSPDFLWVDLTGGEVTLRKDFVEVAHAVIDNCPNLLLLHFPTNGYLTDKIVDNVKRIMERRPEKLIVTVSTDGDEQMNDEIRGIEGGWQRQIETFRRLREIPGVDVVLGMTLSQRNVDHFPVAFAAAEKTIPGLSYRDFHVNIVHESAHYLGNTNLELRKHVPPRAMLDAVKEVARLRGAPRGPVGYLERTYLKHVERYLMTGKTPMRCHALSASCFIDSWGNVFPCTIYDRKLGSLREVDYDLRRIWEKPIAVQTQREIWQYDCPQCWTPCEAYQTIMGNFLAPGRTTPAANGDAVAAPSGESAPAGPAR